MEKPEVIGSQLQCLFHPQVLKPRVLLNLAFSIKLFRDSHICARPKHFDIFSTGAPTPVATLLGTPAAAAVAWLDSQTRALVAAVFSRVSTLVSSRCWTIAVERPKHGLLEDSQGVHSWGSPFRESFKRSQLWCRCRLL